LLSYQRKREKKKSLETVLRMAICGCGLPACCCQPAVAGGLIYSDLRGELSTHLAPQALFTQSSPVHEPLLQAFPFPSTLGEVTLHLLSQAGMFMYSSMRGCPPPSTQGALPSLLCVFFVLLLITQFFFFFPWVWVSLSRGLC
jgi:hypothetical protein